MVKQFLNMIKCKLILTQMKNEGNENGSSGLGGSGDNGDGTSGSSSSSNNSSNKVSVEGSSSVNDNSVIDYIIELESITSIFDSDFYFLE